jgi:hypothetical protein
MFSSENAILLVIDIQGKLARLTRKKDELFNDRKLAQEYETFRAGDNRFTKEEIQSKLADLSFNQKSQNIAGMQIAELVAYPIGKWAMDKKRENNACEKGH